LRPELTIDIKNKKGRRTILALRETTVLLRLGESENFIRSQMRLEYGFHIEIENTIIETAKERAREK